MSDVTEDAWTTKTAAFSNVTLTGNNGRVVVYFNLTDLYVDNIKVYAVYPLEGKSRLIDGDKVFTVDEGTALPMPETEGFNAWKNGDGDLWFAGAPVPEGETLTSCYFPPKYDAQYGELIYFEAFDDNSWSNGYSIGTNAYMYGEGCTIDVGDGYGIGGSATTLIIDNTYLSTLSDVTIFMDVKKAPGSAATGVSIWGDFGGSWPKFSVSDVTEDAWTTKTATFSNVTLTRNNGRVVVYFNLTGLYADNIKVYATYSVADRVRLAQNNDAALYDVTGETFTFPEIDDTALNAWECKDAGIVFAPGETAAKADVLGNTFVAVKAMVYVDETLGELIYFEDFSDNSWSNGYTIGTNAYMYGEGCTIEMGDGYGIGNSPIALIIDNTYLTAASKATLFVDVKKTPGSTATGVDIWGDWGEAWPKFSVTDVTEDAWTTKKAEYSNVSISGNNGRIVLYLGMKGVYADNFYLYAVYNHATGARFVESKFAPSTVVVPDGETYTFASPKNLMYNAWTDGTNVYLAGSNIAASEIIGKLYYPTVVDYNDYAPETQDGVEFRLNGNSAKNGIRFKAAIAPSKKEDLSEMGFIAARSDVLSDMEAELTFDLSGEGTVYVKGVAYDKNGTNIIYGTTDDGSAEVFTAVCVGIDTTNKAHVTSELSVRPYAVLEIAEGNTITVYGDVKCASYYSVASALKTAADAGDETSVSLYNSASYNGGNYIDDIIAVATAE